MNLPDGRLPAAKTHTLRAPYAVGIVNHRRYDDLDRCLASVNAQSHEPSVIIAVDCDPDAQELDRVRCLHPEAIWDPVANIGFAAAANRVFARLTGPLSEVDFVLILNADVRLDQWFVETLLQEMIDRPEVALASGKLVRPDGVTLDGAGIIMPRNRRPRDRGSGERDVGQYGDVEVMFGVSGAAMMVRCSALADLAINGELFDEDFFAYHDDTDLAWRARLLGWSSLYVPAAQAIHHRGWRREARWSVPPEIRRHSFKNHYLEMIKNENGLEFIRDLPVILTWEIFRLGFALLRDWSALRGYASALRLAPRAWEKRQVIQRRIRESSGSKGSGPRAPRGVRLENS